ncbi:hypothetical protein ABPG75_007142 [Micractinium tetrahymenae]
MAGKKRAAAGGPAAEEEEAFVRGGGAGMAPVEKKRMEMEAYAEAAADLAAEASGKKGKRQKKGAAAGGGESGDEEDAFFASLASQDRLPKFVELLKFRTLAPGCKLWGAVIEVTPRELVVSLPHGLRGHVAYAEASDWLAEQAKKADKAAAATTEEAGGRKRKAGAGAGGAALPQLTDLFTIGQLVRCTVTGLRDGSNEGGGAAAADGRKKKKKGSKGEEEERKRRKRVDVSLRLSKLCAGLGPEAVREGLALPACVRSVEDHGYLLSFGIKGVSGFLPKKEAAAVGRPLAPGALLEVVVAPGGVKPAGGGATSATVQCAHEAVSGAVAREWEGLNIGSLLPGQLVTARVRNVLSDGLLCSFLTYFSGTVDPFHLGTDLAADWRKQFSPNQRLRARILWVDPSTKRVGLTLQRHLLGAGLPPNFPALGQVFEGAVVRRVDEGLGLLLELPAGEDALPLTPGYTHISNLADDKVEEVGKRYRLGQRLRARVLGFRPMDGLAALSLKPSVVDQNILSLADLRPGMPVSGTVARVEDFGLLVSVTPTIRALVPTLHATDLGTAKGLKKFKEGQKVAGRVLTVDAASKKVALTLKPSVVGSKLPPIAALQDAAPGARSHGVVTGAADFGVFVQFFGGVAGLAHISECGLAGQKPADAFQPGQVVKCRVLGADPSRKGLKLSLVSKKKAAAGGEAEAAPAAAAGAEGEVAGTAKERPAKGGDAAAAEAALASFQPGDLVRGTVLVLHSKEVDGEPVPAYFELSVTPEGAASSAAPGVGRLEVAHLADHPAAAAALVQALKPGAQLGPLLVLQRLEGAKQLRVTRKASLLSSAAAGLLPRSLEQVAEGSVLAGYVASVTRDAVFVRFLGGLTGRAGLAQLSDTFVSDPHLFFREGQSVRATVVQLEREKERFSVALKQSLCGSRDAALLQSYFSDMEAVEALMAADPSVDHVDWSPFSIGAIVSGEVHEVQDYGLVCDLEANADVAAFVAPHQVPKGAPQEPGSSIRAAVLDINKRDGILDLSLLPRLLQAAQQAQQAQSAAQQAQQAQSAAQQAAQRGGQQPKKKKQRKGEAAAPAVPAAPAELKEGDSVEATIELVKAESGYCVVSLAGPAAQRHPIAFLATADFNLQGQQHARQFAAGEALPASVAALPGPATGGRLLLSTPLTARPLRAAGARAGAATAAGGKAAGQQGGQGGGQQPEAPAAGSLVGATVGAVHALYAELALEGGCHGRLHITEAAPAADGSPLASLSTGDKLEVVVLGRVASEQGRRHGLLECSTQPDTVAAARQAAAGGTAPAAPAQPLAWGRLKPGQQLRGYVCEVEAGHVWCAFSPAIRGRACATQASSSVEECQQLRQRFGIGQPVEATVVAVDSRRHALDVTLLPQQQGVAALQPPAHGSALLGHITAVDGAGVRVQLGARSSGRVALTDIHDEPVQQALEGLEAGQYVQAAVLGPDTSAGGSRGRSKAGGDAHGGAVQLLLSLRPSDGGRCAAHAAAAAAEQQPGGSEAPVPAAGELQAAELKPGQKVAGYVKSAGPPGVFVCLARNLDARIRLNQLADGFVERPAEVFPEGRLVVAQVLKAEGDRVDLTLRSRKVGPSLGSLEEGQVVRGRVKRLAKFGVFVELEGTEAQGATGLAHVSEVADEYVKDLASLFSPGQRVVARVLKVEAAEGKLSLGLKPSYFKDLSDLEGSGNEAAEPGAPDFDADLAAARDDSDAEEQAGGSSAEEGDEEEADEEEGSGSGTGSEEEGEEDEDDEEQLGAGAAAAAEDDESEEEEFDLDEELAEAESDSGSDDE